jgi:nucleotide-binding universal stress UspA family protein
MDSRHILFCYRPGALADRALREACRLACRERAVLTVAVVRDTRPVGRGCCGITAAKWVEILDDVDAQAARRAGDIVRSEGQAAHVAVLGGQRAPELISDYARVQDCDVIAFPVRSFGHGGNPLPRRTLRRLRTLAQCEIVELAG